MTKDHSIELIQKQQEQIDILLKIVWKQFNIIERYHQPTIINTTPGESLVMEEKELGFPIISTDNIRFSGGTTKAR